MNYSVNILGLKELQSTFDKLPAQLRREASGILEAGAKKWVALSKRDSPVDFGVLRNEITYVAVAPLTFEIVSGAKYSPYLEWGTITHVSVPAELSEYAIQFKGRGLRKNGGIFPHPYFFKQQTPVAVQIEKGVQSILNEVKL